MFDNNLQKILKVLLIVIMVISVIVLGIFINAITNLPEGLETEFDKQIEIYGSSLDMIIYWSYFLLGIATVAAVVFPVVRLFTRPKEAIKSLISVVVIAVVVASIEVEPAAAHITLGGKITMHIHPCSSADGP